MRIVIIGGEAAGMSAAAKARRVDKNAEIVVYEASEIISFGACGLPYFIGDAFEDAGFMAEFTPEVFAAKGIMVKTHHRVMAIDPINKTLEVMHNNTLVNDHYDKLMLATGAIEVRPPIEGLSLDGVFGLRTMADGLALKKAVNTPGCHNVAVIGSGFIGLEMVEALVHLGKKVRLIERAARVIPEAFDEEISALIEEELESKGVYLHMSESVQTIMGRDRVTGVKTDRGVYAADLVIVCTGVKPNTDFVRDLGLTMLANGAIVVDKTGQTSLPDIYAAGDCASSWHLLKKVPVYLPLATIANKLGRVVGENIAGGHIEFPGTLGSAAIKVLGIEAGRTGLSEAEAKELGLDYHSIIITDKNHTNYWPGQADISLKLVYVAATKRILGAQILGKNGGAVHRLHALSVAITQGVTTEALGLLDFAYAPPFSRTWDVLNVAGNVAK